MLFARSLEIERRPEDVLRLIRTGRFSTPMLVDKVGVSIPWVSCKDRKVSRIHDSEDTLTEEGAENGTRIVSKGTILIVVRGMILAKECPVAIAQRSVTVNHDLKAIECNDNIDASFFYDWLLANAYEVKGIADEALHGTKRLQTDRLLKLPLNVPPVALQRKIAGILSAYDDLIENNTRRIAILEAMAQAIYREWFVEFRFPGHDKIKLVDSPLGKIPEGWKNLPLSQVADVNAQSIKKGKEPKEVNYVDIASVSTGKIDEVRLLPFAEAPGRARRIIRHGDIIWSTVRPNRKSYSLILNPLENMIASTGFAVISGTKAPFTYLYHALMTEDFVGYLVNHATWSAYPAVNSGDFEKANILVPSQEVLAAFHDATNGMFLLKHNLQEKNRRLRSTRDLLLPKLISGQVDVEGLDIETGEALTEEST